jgi:hypothetical protein
VRECRTLNRLDSRAAGDPLVPRTGLPPFAKWPGEGERKLTGGEGTRPPGVIEAFVVQTKPRLRRGVALLWPEGERHDMTAGLTEPPSAIAPVAADGRIQFEGLSPGGWWVGLDLGDGAIRRYQFYMTGERATPPKVIVLGESVVSGRVFDRDGRPVPRALVCIWTQGREGSDQFSITRTDADGRYQLDSLCASNVEVTVGPPSELELLRPSWIGRTEIGESEQRIVDFHLDPGTVDLSARVLDQCRRPLPKGWRFLLRGVVTTQVSLDAKGHFTCPLPQGSYRIVPHRPTFPGQGIGHSAASIEPSSFEVGMQPLNLEFIVQGCRIEGAIAVKGSVRRGSQLGLVVEGGAWADGSLSFVNAPVPSGGYVTFVPGPGTYTLRARLEEPNLEWLLRQGNPAYEVGPPAWTGPTRTIHVRPGDRCIRCDLVVEQGRRTLPPVR